MKNIFVKTIELYQATPLHTHSLCRFRPTCSQYMKEAIESYGSFKGIGMGFRRLLRCHPFGKHGYDPVPEKEGSNNEKE